MATQILVNIGSGNGLLPDSSKPLPEPMLTYHVIVSMDQWCLYEGNFTGDTPAINHENQLQFAKIKFLWNPPGANELIDITHIAHPRQAVALWTLQADINYNNSVDLITMQHTRKK